MAVVIRDFTDNDLDWAVDLLVDWDPSLPADQYRRVMAGEAGTLRRSRVVESGGSPAGLGTIIDFEGLSKPLLSVVVARPERGVGLGSHLFADLWPHLPPGGAMSGLPDGDDRSLAVARHWGFDVLGHGIESVLTMPEPPPEPVLPTDVRVVHVPAAHPAGHDIASFLVTVGDFPEAEVYGNSISNAGVVQLAPDALWLLLVDDVGILVGIAMDPRDSTEWYVLFTGSSPRARGRGLARSAKQAAHRLAFERGARSIRTTNEARNARIRALNASLGYVPVSGDIRLVRER